MSPSAIHFFLLKWQYNDFAKSKRLKLIHMLDCNFFLKEGTQKKSQTKIQY